MIVQNLKFKIQNCSLKFKIIFFFINFAFLIVTFNFALLTFNLDKAEASALSLGVYPPLVQIEADPGTVVKTPITLQNFGDKTVNLQISFKPFTASQKENGEIEYLATDKNPEQDAIFKRIQILEKDEFLETITLAPKQEKNIDLVIDLPKDETLSDYYFSIIFTSNDNNFSDSTPVKSESKNNLTNTSVGIASNIILSVGNKGKLKGYIEEFSAPSFLEKGPVPFKLRVKNAGSRVITPKGAITITNMFGQTIGKVNLLPVNILASTTRLIPAVWPENFLLGPYTATLNLAFSDNGPVIARTIRFFGLPIQIIIGIFLTIVIVIAIRNRVKSKLM